MRGCPTNGSVLAGWIRRVVRYGTVIAAVAAITGSAVAATPFGPPARVTPTLPPAETPGPKLADGQLRETVKDLQAGRTPPAGVKVMGDLVQVEIVHDLGVAAIRRAVQQHGGTVEGGVPGELTEAVVPFDRLAALEQQPGITYIRRPLLANEPVATGPPSLLEGPNEVQAAGGSIIGQEVAKTNADAWQTAGYTGAGVKVGIIDFFDTNAWNAALAAGEVPPPAGTFCQSNGSPCNLFLGGAQHGVAVAEVIHEMAPDAQLYLATVVSISDLQAAVNYFANQGVKIISRSLGSQYDGPGDGTGPIGTVVNSAVSQGIAWFNSAGNSGGPWVGGTAGSYWRGSWIDSNANGFIEFAPGQEGLGFGCGFVHGMRWSDWGTPAGRTNYDVYFYDDPNLQQVVASGQANQQAGANPVELPNPLYNCNSNSPIDYIAIRLINPGSGTAGDVLEYMLNSTGVGIWQNPFSATQPASDSASTGALSIGAVDPPLGLAIAPYSSWGPTNDLRMKPELSAAAGVSSLSYPQAGGFRGTSAAAPAAAGAAALVIQAGLGNTPAQLRTYLMGATHDRGAAGPDSTYGSGELVLPPPPGGGSGKVVFTSHRTATARSTC